MAEKVIPRAAVARLVKKAVDAKVSADAREELAIAIEEIGTEVAKKAHELAKFAGRKTVTLEDIHLAAH